MIKKIICLLAFAFVLMPVEGWGGGVPVDYHNSDEVKAVEEGASLLKWYQRRYISKAQAGIEEHGASGRRYLLIDYTTKDGKRGKYYLDDIEAAFEFMQDVMKKGDDPCFNNESEAGMLFVERKKWVNTLYFSCREALGKHRIAAGESGFISDKVDSTIEVLVRHGVTDGVTEDTLGICSLDVLDVKQAIEESRDDIKVSKIEYKEYSNLLNNVNKCLEKMATAEYGVAPILWGFREYKNYADSFADCDKKSWKGEKGKSVYKTIANERLDLWFLNNENPTFYTQNANEKIDTNSMFVYIDGTLILCEGKDPKKIVYPVYSGREGCQTAEYAGVQDVGGVPKGLYLLSKDNVEQMAWDGEKTIEDRVPYSQAEIWGNWRVILNPEINNEMYNRSSMYLHGREHPTKIKQRKSAGCLNVGWEADNIVYGEIKNKKRNILLYVAAQSEVPSKSCKAGKKVNESEAESAN